MGGTGPWTHIGSWTKDFQYSVLASSPVPNGSTLLDIPPNVKATWMRLPAQTFAAASIGMHECEVNFEFAEGGSGFVIYECRLHFDVTVPAYNLGTGWTGDVSFANIFTFDVPKHISAVNLKATLMFSAAAHGGSDSYGSISLRTAGMPWRKFGAWTRPFP